MDRADPRKDRGGVTIFRRVMSVGIDLLYPPRCAGCGRVDTIWCAHCQDDLDRVAVDLHIVQLPPLFSIAATGIHEGKLQQAVHALKYEGVESLAFPLADRLVAAIDTLGWVIDVIVPVPLHPSRQRARGYNQAEQLGMAVARRLDIPCDPAAILRQRDTPPQVGLNRQQRQANMRSAFQAATSLSGSILLIDDVFTTGATLQSCAQAARDGGAAAVYGLTVTAARP